ncbi:hypothetical protein PENTCL1PPCAC_3023, partial [Pristionchus entomophagus]
LRCPFISMSEPIIIYGANDCIPVAEAIKAQGIDDITTKVFLKTFFTLVYSFIFFVGLIANLGVLIAVLQNRRLRSARNIFLLNLILTDLLLVLTAVPVTPWYALTKNWQFGTILCHLMPLSNSCSVFVTSWSLTAIAIDKFLHIIDPTLAPVSKRQALATTILIWVLSTLINVPYLMSYELVDGSYYVGNTTKPFCGHFCDETNWQSENSRRMYGTMVMLLQFVIPMAIISYCYFRILNKVSKDSIVGNDQFAHSLSQKQRLDAMSRKKRVNYILIGMVMTFIGCWLPLTCVNLLKDFKSEPSFITSQPFFWPLIAHFCAMSLVIWNPLLFFWLTRKQKRMMGLSKIINTSEVVASFTSRLSSLRRPSTRRPSSVVINNNTAKIRQRTATVDSDNSTAASRPLVLPHPMLQSPSGHQLAPPDYNEHNL